MGYWFFSSTFMSLHTDYKVREYLISLYKNQIQARGLSPDKIPDSFDLLKEGIIDSLGIMELVTSLEGHFGHTIDFEELDAEHMTIIGPLTAHIERKLTEFETAKTSADLGLAALPKGVVRLKGKAIEVWLALDDSSIRKGLIGVQADELAPRSDGGERGMLFVFPHEQPLSFWMFKTIVPLDIIYVDAERRIINGYSAQPLETRLLYPSQRPAQFVLEVNAGLMKRWGVEPGDTLELPANLPSVKG
jgi:uncharacterized protein